MRKKQIYCNHRHDNNLSDSLRYDPETQYCTCTKCRAKFKPIGLEELKSTAKIEESLEQLDTLLNTLKLLASDSPELMNEINKMCKAAHKLRKLPDLTAISVGHAQAKDIDFWNNFSKMQLLPNLNRVSETQCLNSIDLNLPRYVAGKEQQASMLNTFPKSYSKEDIEKITESIKTEKKEEK